MAAIAYLRWSVFNKPISASNPQWSPGAAPYAFSVAIVFLGLTAAFGGNETVRLLFDWIVVIHIACAALCLDYIRD